MTLEPFDLEGVERLPAQVAAGLLEELPGLGLLAVALDVVPGRSPRGVRRRLRDLSSRFSAPEALVMRQRPVPHAYRVFFRHVGLDPDVERPPAEEAAVRRLIVGEFRSENLLDDALTIALIETGVPIWALDSTRTDGQLVLRLSEDGERLGAEDEAPPVAPGRIVLADGRGPLAVAFGTIAPGHGVTDATRRLVLFSVVVAGVPAIAVEEAVWTCVDVLRSA